MTLIAHFDTTQNPPIVISLHDYGTDRVPAEYQPPEYLDVTSEDPPPQVGSTYHQPSDVWNHPPPPLDPIAWAAEKVAENDIYLAIPEPDWAQAADQVTALTTQMNDALRERFDV